LDSRERDYEMKIKVNELTDAALDWAVGMTGEYGCGFFSTDWSQGGPLIEREKITLEHLYGAGDAGADVWVATLTCEDKKFGGVECFEEQGPTPLIAAMRCYVASKLGDTVDIPEGLK
jgi:hypothetical protein